MSQQNDQRDSNLAAEQRPGRPKPRARRTRARRQVTGRFPLRPREIAKPWMRT